MNSSPIKPPESSDKQSVVASSSTLHKVGQVMGYVWKSIRDFPSNVLFLILKITHAVTNVFTNSPEEDTGPKEPAKVKLKPADLASTSLFKKKVTEEEDLEGISRLFEETTVVQLKEDPLATMSSIAPRDEPLAQAPVEPIVSQALSGIDDEISVIIKEVVQPAQTLLIEPKPASLEAYNVMTKQLDDEYSLLKEYLPRLVEMKEAHQTVQTTLKAIEEKMAQFGDDILNPAEAVLRDVERKEHVELQDYLISSARLDEAMDHLKVFASRFVNAASGLHLRVQAMISALETKKTSLDAMMCEQVRLHYKPNSAIPAIGNCQFESIRHQLKNVHKQKHYRQLAVQYMRDHLVDFRIGIEDTVNRGQVRASMKRYAREISKLHDKSSKPHLAAWTKQLETKLGRKPDSVDLYLDCMENYTFWGESNTILALSEALKMPILVFTKQTDKKWRFDLMAGQTKYSDRPPLLLYYNGNDHYQDLIPR